MSSSPRATVPRYSTACAVQLSHSAACLLNKRSRCQEAECIVHIAACREVYEAECLLRPGG